METEPDLSPPLAEAKFSKTNLSRPININPDSTNFSHSFIATSTYNSTTSSSSSSPPDLVRHVQAAFKRHRPLGIMQSNGIKPRRFAVRQPEATEDSRLQPLLTFDAKNSREDVPQSHRPRVSVSQSKNMETMTGQNQEDASITLPSEWGSIVNTLEENIKPSNAQRDQPAASGSNDTVAVETGNVLAEVQKKVHFATEKNAKSRDDLMSHLDSLALTEMEWDARNHLDTSAAVSQDWQHHNIQRIEMDNGLRSEGGMSSVTAGKTMPIQDQLHQLGNFLQSDLSNAMTQSSVVGSSCVTSTLIDSTAAPMISSTSYSSQTQMNNANLSTEPAGKTEGDNSAKGNAINAKSQPPSSKISMSDARLENSKSEKLERGASGKGESISRKKGYDPDLFSKLTESFIKGLAR